MLRILHIINPVDIGEQSDLHIAQPITFESMHRAKAHVDDSKVQVSLHAVCYAEDMHLVPTYFDGRSELSRSVLDEGSFVKSRKLPLITDLMSAPKEEEYDIVIYTNVDIAVMPDFYAVVAERFAEGIDAFIINRRTISSDFERPEQLSRMYAQAGEKHPGMDCFVMSRQIADQLFLAKTCIGVDFIGKVLEANIIAHAKQFHWFKDDHLTFHLGDDQTWKNPSLADYRAYNKEEFHKVLMHTLNVAKSGNNTAAVERLKDHLYKYHDWNEDGANPYLRPASQPSDPWSDRIKRSIGALMGKS